MPLPHPPQLNAQTRTMLKEFKDFAIKGNMVDLAVGVIIGTAFGKIIESLVRDVIMPPISLITGGVDFTNKFVVLKTTNRIADNTLEAARKADAVVFAYGNFLTLFINFLIIACAVFLVVKLLQRLKAREAAAPPAPVPPTRSELLLTEIRDLLKSKP